MINQILDTILRTLNTGIDKAIIMTLFIASCLACIDFILSMLYEWSESFTQFFKMFWKKIINYTFIFVLIKNWKVVMNQVLNIAFSIGYLFFPREWTTKLMSSASNKQTPDLDGIYNVLMENVLLFDQRNHALPVIPDFFTKLVMMLITIVLLVCIFLIVKELVIQVVQFYVAACIGVILLVFSVFEQTKSIGSKIFNTMLNSFMALLTALAIVGVGLRATKDAANLIDPTTFEQTVQLGDMMHYMFVMMIIAYLVNCSKEFANGIMNGNVTANGGGTAIMGAIGKAVTTAVGAAAALATAGAAAPGIVGALKTVKAAEGVNKLGKIKAATQGMKKAYAAAKNTRIGKIGKAVKGAIDTTAKVAIGQMSLGQFVGAATKGTLNTIGTQINHDSVGAAVEKDMSKEMDANNMTVSDFASELSEDELKFIESEWNNASSDSEIKQNYNSLEKYVSAKKFEKAYAKRDIAKKLQQAKREASEYAHAKSKITGEKGKANINKFKEEYMKNFKKEKFEEPNKKSSNGNSSKQNENGGTQGNNNTNNSFNGNTNNIFNEDFNSGSNENSNFESSNNTQSDFSASTNSKKNNFNNDTKNNFDNNTNSNEFNDKFNFKKSSENYNENFNSNIDSQSTRNYTNSNIKHNVNKRTNFENTSNSNGFNVFNQNKTNINTKVSGTREANNVNSSTQNYTVSTNARSNGVNMDNNFSNNTRNYSSNIDTQSYNSHIDNVSNNSEINTNSSMAQSNMNYDKTTNNSYNNNNQTYSSENYANNTNTYTTYTVDNGYNNIANETFSRVDNSYNKFEEKTFMKSLNSDPMTTASMASDKLKNSTSFIGKAVSKNGQTLQFASESLKDDAWIVKRAIKNDPTSIKFASERLRNDPEIQKMVKEISKSKGIKL